MSRVRIFRRKSHDEEYDEIPQDVELPPFEEDEELPFVPFVPVESERSYGIEDDALAPEESRVRRGSHLGLERPRLRRPTLQAPESPVRVRFGMLLLVVALIGLGIFGTLLNLDEVEGDVREWWPVAALAIAALWMLVALVRRRIPAFLGATALAGASLSFLLNTQDIASVEETLLGVVLVTLGFGIVVRGFLLRQQTFG